MYSADFVDFLIQKEIVFQKDYFHKWKPQGNHFLHRQMKREEKRQRGLANCPYVSRITFDMDRLIILEIAKGHREFHLFITAVVSKVKSLSWCSFQRCYNEPVQTTYI